MNIPVITVDGPTASGKGTVAQRVADALQFHYLDSGSLYRLVALQSLEQGVGPEAAADLARLGATLDPRFVGGRVLLDGRDVTDAIRAEAVGVRASQIAVLAPLRAALLDLQRGFRKAPGLVADGRDMGTVVFPDAALKVYLTATPEARAERRLKQLSEKGIPVILADLAADLRARDARDMQRASAPLKPAQDAYQLDSSSLTIDEVAAQIIDWYRQGSIDPRT
jgi:cytidylate kinase